MVILDNVLNKRSLKTIYKAFVFWGVVLLVFLASSVRAQYVPEDNEDLPRNNTGSDKKFNLSDRLFYTGGFGLQFGNLTYIEASPMIGLILTERLRAGTGFSYIYFRDNIINYTTNIYGGRVFGQADIYEGFFGHIEYEVLNGAFGLRGERRNVNSFFIGGGYRSAFGGNFFGTLMVLYNVTADIYSPYTNPVIRVGIGYGL